MLLPREHGSWALLFGPMTLAFVAFGFGFPESLLLILSATSLFLAREPLASLVRQWGKKQPSAKQPYWWKWLGIYSLIGALPGLALLILWGLWDLLLLGGMAAFVLGIHLIWVSQRDERNLGAEWLGVGGLCLTGVAAQVVSQGQLNWDSFRIWLLCWLFFSSGLLYVRMRIARMVGKNAGQATLRCVVYHGLLVAGFLIAVAMGRLSVWVALTYAPIVLRTLLPLLRPDVGRLNLKRIGYQEVFNTILFVVTCGLALRWV